MTKPFGGIAVCALFLAACTYSPVSTPSGVELVSSPPVEEVESVLFLLGDAGEAIAGTSPLLERLRQDVEWWSGKLQRDSAVALIVLGDIVYPLGLNPPDSEWFDWDTTVVMSQVRVVGGPTGLDRFARGYFLAGNHDWGMREDWEGFVRLAALDGFLADARRRTGALVELAPEAGSGGPTVIDWGETHRLLFLDTAWWLLEGRFEARQRVLRSIEEAFATAGDRQMMLFAHHPFKSGGPHGGGFSFWETVGLRYVLYRSGAILQDVTSRPYRELEAGLRGIFARYGPPQVFAGGHEHNLQVIEGIDPSDPRINLVSGSGSKLTSLGPLPGMVFGQSVPGYMRLVIERNGTVSVFVEAVPVEFQSCPREDPARTTCMAEGIGAFQTVFSRRLE